jgi:hypothetical protein
MKLFKFYELYEQDVRYRIKENTWATKEHIIETKILPYLGNMEISQIMPRTIRLWQNKIMKLRDENGKPFSPSYLATVHSQLSCMLNHAVKFYGLRNNPAKAAGGMGE